MSDFFETLYASIAKMDDSNKPLTVEELGVLLDGCNRLSRKFII